MGEAFDLLLGKYISTLPSVAVSGRRRSEVFSEQWRTLNAHFWQDHIDIIVNNAGVYIFADSQHLSVADWDRLMGVNLRSVFLLTKFAIPHLTQSPAGRIINTWQSNMEDAKSWYHVKLLSDGNLLVFGREKGPHQPADEVQLDCEHEAWER